MESSRYRPEEGGPVWFQTGVHTPHFKETMEKTLNIKLVFLLYSTQISKFDGEPMAPCFVCFPALNS